MSASDSSPFQQPSQSLTPLNHAELHGLLCGLLCARMDLDRDQWLRHAQEALADEREFSPETDDLLGQLYDEHMARNDHLDELMTPVLPDDDIALSQRVDALGHWCQGLLYGLGLGEIGKGDRLSEESQEFLQDVADIAQVGCDPDEGGEADESAYVEIVEYLRVGWLMIQQDIEHNHCRTH